MEIVSILFFKIMDRTIQITRKIHNLVIQWIVRFATNEQTSSIYLLPKTDIISRSFIICTIIDKIFQK